MYYSGIVEGFFGKAWSWDERKAYSTFLKKNKFNFYLYAPKADSFLRKSWKQPFPKQHFEHLKGLAKSYRDLGVSFGIGLSPFEVFHRFDSSARQQLREKLHEIDRIKPAVLGLLFDDMDGNVPDLARLQAEIINFVSDNTETSRLLFCPTYYSDDVILDKVFGKRPEHYLEDLGREVASNVDFFWTGPKVISEELTAAHLSEVNLRIGRKPFIWDNYPVNDGPRNCKYLHIDAIKGRDPLLSEHTSGYVSNSMNQSELSKIPLLTISDMLNLGRKYDPEKSFNQAVINLYGESHVRFFSSIRTKLKERGLDQLTHEEKEKIISQVNSIGSRWAEELLDFIDGKYTVGNDCLTQ